MYRQLEHVVGRQLAVGLPHRANEVRIRRELPGAGPAAIVEAALKRDVPASRLTLKRTSRPSKRSPRAPSPSSSSSGTEMPNWRSSSRSSCRLIHCRLSFRVQLSWSRARQVPSIADDCPPAAGSTDADTNAASTRVFMSSFLVWLGRRARGEGLEIAPPTPASARLRRGFGYAFKKARERLERLAAVADRGFSSRSSSARVQPKGG